MDPHGNHVGFIAEEDSLANSMSRQLLRTHRKFNAVIMNAEGDVVFKVDLCKMELLRQIRYWILT
jgi:hypothetical protein